MDVKDVLEKWLGENGYDGLVNTEGPCGCSIGDDFIECDALCPECEPAYKHKANCKECEDICDGKDEVEYCMSTIKPKEGKQ